jgi:hypothetical protein
LALQAILNHPGGFRSLVVSSAYASYPQFCRGLKRLVARGIEGSKLVFRKCGHDAMQKERDLYVKTILDFLDSLV